MMKLWILQGTHENEMFNSVHLTEKGCVLAAISDVLEFLGVDDEETALSVINDCYTYTETDGEQTEAFEWDYDKMKEMKSKDLWKVFNDWTETCWERMVDRAYHIDARPTVLVA
tara:strand:+ start:461 stop:802 length:342 start_codon:yes stop_codon:yes gene_type:complete